MILQYIDKDRLLDYLHKTVIFSGRIGSPYLKGQVDGAKLVISRVVDYNEDKTKVVCSNCGYHHSDGSELIQGYICPNCRCEIEEHM